MSEIQLFRLATGHITELPGRAAAVEKQLQALIEAHMPAFLGVRFLASEYATGKTHKGRIDSLGLDENNCPVIVEYKRHSNENVINQGLFYLDWLLDHRAEFQWLVMEKLGKDTADGIDWAGTRLLCIAADFTRYDQHAVQQIPRNIELLRYKLFDDDLLLLELVNSVSVADATAARPDAVPAVKPKAAGKDKSFDEQLALATPDIRAAYETLAAYLLALGDDVQERKLKLYTAFRRLKNFASVVMYPNRMLVMLKVDPDSVALEPGFSRDVRQIGHWGTGDLELTLASMADFEKAKPLLDRSYSES
jgi:predicted transport protein